MTARIFARSFALISLVTLLALTGCCTGGK